jgi:NitT/TauT family transport system permease protein
VLTIFVVLLLTLWLSGLIQIDRALFLKGFTASFFRVTVSYLISFVLAIALAIIATSHRSIENIFLPILDVLQSFPSFVLFPVLVSVLNEPNTVIIIVLVITMVWPILFAIISGIKSRRNDLEEAATIFGATGQKRFWNFTLPMLLPSIISGSIVGWGEGWEFIIGAELLVHTKFGIGKYLGELSSNDRSIALTVGVILLLLFLFVINRLIWLPLLRRSTEFQADA